MFFDWLVSFNNLRFQTMGFGAGLSIFLKIPLRNLALTYSAQDGVSTDRRGEGEWRNKLDSSSFDKGRSGGRRKIILLQDDCRFVRFQVELEQWAWQPTLCVMAAQSRGQSWPSRFGSMWSLNQTSTVWVLMKALCSFLVNILVQRRQKTRNTRSWQCFRIGWKYWALEGDFYKNVKLLILYAWLTQIKRSPSIFSSRTTTLILGGLGLKS